MPEDLVELCLEFRLDDGILGEVAGDSAGGTRIYFISVSCRGGSKTVEIAPSSGTRASIQITESLTDKFWASHGLPLIILPLYEFAKNIHLVGEGLETLGDNGSNEFDEIRGSRTSRTIPWVEFPQYGPDPLWKNTQ